MTHWNEIPRIIGDIHWDDLLGVLKTEYSQPFSFVRTDAVVIIQDDLEEFICINRYIEENIDNVFVFMFRVLI